MLFKDTNQIKRNYYLNLFSANAEIVKNGNNNFMYEWNIRDLQLGKYSEIALVQLASINADITVERQYPPKAFNSSTSQIATTELSNVAATNKMKETITLDTTGITYGSGTYNIYSSTDAWPGGGFQKKDLFNYVFNDTGGIWTDDFTRYNQTTGYFARTDCYIKDTNYYGDWVILNLPNPILLTRFRFYFRLTFPNLVPSLWRCYGSNDGINWDEIKEASNDVDPLTTASYTGQFYEQKVNENYNTYYNYIGFVVNKVVSNTASGILNFAELQLFGREKLNIMPPVMWYKFDGSATDMLLDSSGNNYHLTNSGATFDGTNFKRGYGSSAFNHTTQQHLIIPSINLYNIQSKKGITFSLWFRMNTTNTGTWARIFDFNSGSVNTWIIISRHLTNNTLNFHMKNGAEENNRITTNNYVDGNWHHVIWSIDNVGKWTIYIDGVIPSLSASLPTNVNIPNITFTNSFFGRSLFSGDGYLSGNIDDFRIYDYVLSANEISGLYYGTDPTTQNKYIIRSLNCYDDGYDSQNTTSAVLYMSNELKSPPEPTYHKLNTYNLNRISLQVSNDIDTNKPYNGWNSNIHFGAVFHIVDNQDNNI